MDLVLPDALAVIAIRLEGDIESFEGKIAIGNVIRNRMRFGYQSDGTVAGTVLKAAQFSAFNTSHPLRPALFRAQVEDPRTVAAVLAWQQSATMPLVGKSVLYYNPKAMTPTNAKPEWEAKARFVKKVGSHLFYEDPVLDGKEG